MSKKRKRSDVNSFMEFIEKIKSEDFVPEVGEITEGGDNWITERTFVAFCEDGRAYRVTEYIGPYVRDDFREEKKVEPTVDVVKDVPVVLDGILNWYVIMEKEGWTMEEFAAMLGMNYNTVRTTLSKSVKTGKKPSWIRAFEFGYNWVK